MERAAEINPLDCLRFRPVNVPGFIPRAVVRKELRLIVRLCGDRVSGKSLLKHPYLIAAGWVPEAAAGPLTPRPLCLFRPARQVDYAIYGR